MSWSNLTEWWLAEIGNDPAYEDVVTPLLLGVFEPKRGKSYLDLGCGEGRVMRHVSESEANVIGVDLNAELAAMAGASVIAELPELPFLDDSVDGAYSVLTLEHLEDHERFFAESARVVRPGGVLSIVINHPAWTAPGSTPITDDDGEVLFRPGDYFGAGYTDEPVGDSKVRFHHRSLGVLLSSAAAAGFSLEKLVEQPHHALMEQGGIPRLLAVRWARLP